MQSQSVKNRKQLAAEYNVSPKTFDKLIAPVRILLEKADKRKRCYTPKDVLIIQERLGFLSIVKSV